MAEDRALLGAAEDGRTSELVASAVRELRRPLDEIVGTAAVLLLEELTATQQEHVERILGSARALLSVVDEVIDLATMETGELTLRAGELDLAELLYEAAEHHAGSGTVEVSCLVHPAIDTAFVGDAPRLRRILATLVANAVERTARGDVVVSAHLKADRGDSAMLEIGVVRTGVEAAPEPERADAARSGEHRVLSLAMCRHLVTMMGGSFEVTRETSGGAVRFTLALRKGGALAARAGERALRGRRLLVLTPSGAVAGHLRALLGHAGALTEVHVDPIAALGALVEAADAGRPYDAAVLDTSAHAMSGLDVARWMTRQRSCEATRVVLLVSPQRRMADDESARIDAVVSKPIRPDRLVDAVAGASDATSTAAAGRSRVGTRVRRAVSPSPGAEPSQPATPRRCDAIDRAALELLRREGGRRERLVQQAIRRFLRDLHDRLDALRRSALRGHRSAMVSQARTLARSAAVVGAARLAKLSAELEAAATGGDLERSRALLGLLESEAVDVQAELESFGREQRPPKGPGGSEGA